MKINIHLIVAVLWLVTFWVLFIGSFVLPFVLWWYPLAWGFLGLLALYIYAWLTKA